MRLLHAGVDTSVIALWLGHVSVETTQIYLHADLDAEGASTRQNPTTQRPDRPIPAHPTACSPGSKRSDYADLASPKPLPCNGIQRPHRHNPEVGIMHHAGLHDRLRPDRADRVGQPVQPVADDDEHVVHATVFDLGEHVQPVLRALPTRRSPAQSPRMSRRPSQVTASAT